MGSSDFNQGSLNFFKRYFCNYHLPKPDEPEPKRQSLRGAQRRGNPDNFIKGLLNGWIAALRSQ